MIIVCLYIKILPYFLYKREDSHILLRTVKFYHVSYVERFIQVQIPQFIPLPSLSYGPLSQLGTKWIFKIKTPLKLP